MRWLRLAGFVAMGVSCKSKPAPLDEARFATSDEAKTFYALGYSLGPGLQSYNLSAADLGWVEKGLADSVLKNEPPFPVADYGAKILQLARGQAVAQVDAQRALSKEFLRKAAAEPGARTLGSGLVYRELKAGSGPPPGAHDKVRVHYRGLLPDGTEFDSSYKRGVPAEFSLAGVIGCWSEGIALMKVGGKAKLGCPPGIAYGETGAPPSIPAGAALAFEVDLLGVTK